MKAKKKNKPLSFAAALTHAQNDTFKYLESPPVDVIERLLSRYPQLVFAVPQASKEMQIACVKWHGGLLLTKLEWKFDIEAEFPGGTVFCEYFMGQLVPRVDKAHFHDSALLITHLMEIEWQRFARLSDWGNQLGKTEREVLKSFEYEEVRVFIDSLLENGPSHMRTSKTDTEDFGASLNNAMEFA
jgi:hypothetical protein